MVGADWTHSKLFTHPICTLDSSDQTADVDNLNIIHVAGTKGKGSTCAFTESFLRAFQHRTGFPAKSGLYTSPHLICAEERIRINFQPIDRDLFAKYFFEVWDVLESTENPPRYLQLLALVAFHTFIREGVQAAIFETHHGGEYDATNVIEHPVVSVVTPLGMDHANQLGPTLRNIAWHKSGIFKAGAVAISAPQDAEAAEVLQKRAEEKGLDLQVVGDNETLPTNKIQLKPDVQRSNCSVGLAAAQALVSARAPEHLGQWLPADTERGVSQFFWPGRFQYLNEGKFHWFLDGAHNEMSVVKAAEWFLESSKLLGQSSVPRVLIFNQISNERDANEVLKCLAGALKPVEIRYVVFADYDPHPLYPESHGTLQVTNPCRHARSLTPGVGKNSHTASKEGGGLAKEFIDIWNQYQPESEIFFEQDVKSALGKARELGEAAGGVETLLTGSLFLVGGALRCLRPRLA
jgi:folylpolyglutamate synthase